MLGLLALLFLSAVCSPVSCTGVGYEGCFPESVRQRHFAISPGNYQPQGMKPNYCRERCGASEYEYAALAHGEFCFCSHTPSASAAVADTFCDMPCVGNGAVNCGSQSYVSVYSTIEPLAGLEVTSDVSGILATPATVTLSVSIEQGSNIQYRADYSDGAGFTHSNATGFQTRILYLPGSYSAIVSAQDEYQTHYASTGFMLEGPVSDVEVTCDPVFATYQEGQCEVIVWSGSNLKLDAVLPQKPSFDLQLNQIADPAMSMVGAWIPGPNLTTGGGDEVIVLQKAIFPNVGKIYGWKMHVEAAGSLEILVLSPACGGGNTYCYDTNDCRATCRTSNSFEKSSQCSFPPEQQCAQTGTCAGTCSGDTRFGAASFLADNYVVTFIVPVSPGTTGTVWLDQSPPLDVAPGDVLGIHHSVGGGVISVDAATDPDILMPFAAPTVGASYTQGSGSAYPDQHLLQAMFSAGSKVLLKYTFNGDPGEFPLNVTATNINLPNTAKGSTMIYLLEGVNFAIIEGPVYATPGTPTVFTLMEHTGGNLTYDWDISDGSPTTHGVNLTYIFLTPGVYNISIAIYNAISRKDNYTTVFVEEELTGLNISAPNSEINVPVPITIDLTSGSDYSCTLDFGDSSTESVTDSSQTVVPTSAQSHTYFGFGLYTLTITCQNNVSTATATSNLYISEAIVNLRLEQDGAAVNAPFRIAWLVDAGNDITFSLELDGVAVSVDTTTSTPITYRWESVELPARSAGSYPLVLVATNPINTMNVTVGFIILEPIVGFTLSSDLFNVTTDDTVTFTLDMTGGSDVTVQIIFQDGSTNYLLDTLGAPWTSALTVPHDFINGCLCSVTARVSNAAGSHTLSVDVFVRVGFSTISWSLPDVSYYLYEPPADVDFQFSSNITAMPTDPTIEVDWGDNTPVAVSDTIVFGAPGYTHRYDDTQDYILTVTMSNILGSKVYTHRAIVVEKLVGPNIVLEFTNAPLNQPFNVTFQLYRGDQGNLTMLQWDVGDGNPPIVTERQGKGENAGDTMSVTYTTPGMKTITVTATAPLNQLQSATATVEVIQPVVESALTITTNGDVSPGSPVTFTIQYNSADIPPNAEILIDYYGDGSMVSAPTSFTITTNGGTQTVSFTYPQDGLHNATVIVRNPASSVEKSVPVGVYDTFSNLQVAVTYQPTTTDQIPVDQTGLQSGGNLFPLDAPVKFTFTDDNNAFATQYEVRSTSGPVPVIQTGAVNGVEFVFPQEGTFTLDMTASNPLDTATIQRTITLVKRVKGLKISMDDSGVAPGEAKNLNISFTDYGADTCVYIDWGNLGDKTVYSDNPSLCTDPEFANAVVGGDMTQLTTQPVSHRYLSEGTYTIKIKAENAYGVETSESTFTVSYEDCANPKVRIYRAVELYYEARKQTQSSIIRVRGMAAINCADNLDNQKMWQLDAIDDANGAVTSSVDISSLETSKAELYIPAKFLTAGVYKASYSMVMVDDNQLTTFIDTASTYFQVVDSDLYAMMVDGGVTEIIRGSAQRVLLEPLKYSTDPDLDPSAPQGIVVDSWDCEITTAGAVQTSCNQVVANAQSQDIDAANLVQGYTYKISAHMSKGTRTVSAIINVLIDGTNRPTPTIRCLDGSVCYPRGDGFTALESSRIALRCECAMCAPTVQYMWSVFLKDYRWDDGWRPLREAEIQEQSISIYSRDLALEKSLFQRYADTTNVFKAQCDVSDPTLGNTSLATHVFIDQPPTGGNCTVAPKNATSTPSADKLWHIRCWDWTDKDGIKEYQFYSKFDDMEVVKEITSIPTDAGYIEVDVSLPVGPAYRNYQQDIYVLVKDTLGAAATVKVDTVEVWPPDAAELRQMVSSIINDDTNSFFKVFQEGDQRSVSELATAVSTIMNADAMNSQEEYAGYEVPGNWICTGYGPYDVERPMAYKPFPDERDEYVQYAYDKQRNDRAEFKTEIIKYALDLSHEDAVSIQQVAGLLAQVTSVPTEITTESQNLILDGLETMIANLQDPLKMANTPQEDIEKAMNNIFSTMGAVMEATGTNGKFPTLDEMDETRKDPLWLIYDTSIKSLGDKTDVSSARSYEEANNMHTRNVHIILHHEHAKEVARKVDKMKRNLVKLFNTYAIPGQVLESTTYRLKYRMEKNFAKTFAGKTLKADDSDAEIQLPDDINKLFAGLAIGPDDLVIAEIDQGTNSPNRYSDYAQEALHPYTHFINVDFFDENGDLLSINRTSQPIKIVIPHDDNGPRNEEKAVRALITKWNRFQLHQTETTALGSSIHVKFDMVKGTQLIVVAKYNRIPDVEKNDTDFIFLVPPTVPPDSTLDDPYTILLTGDDLGDRVGKWWFGTRERESQYINNPVPSNADLIARYPNGSGPFINDYNLTVWVSGCYFLSNGADDWKTHGCQVTTESTQEKTVCSCTHLTTFAGGFVVVPNVIDWNYVFSNADFLSNPTLYITEIFIAIVFIIAFVMARRKDKADMQLLGLAPLADNNPKDKYFYEVIVSTGMRRNAGTDSNVCFIMSGENDETEVRMFNDSKRPIFKRGMRNGFLMAVPESLGRINYMRVWHDNSGKGKFGSWYLNYIVVRDLQKDTRQVFIANRWFAVEEDDGMIDRIIPLAGKEQLEEFSYQFKERSKKDLADGHLWFSVIARPPGSRFTCVQRVACCLCLLFMTMLTNAMFYQTEENTSTSSSTSFEIGPFALSLSQIFIGFISTLIVFPINFLLVFLFRKSQPRQKRTSRILLAFNDGRQKPVKLSQVNPQVGTGSQISLGQGDTASLGSSPGQYSDQGKLVNDANSRSVSPTSKGAETELIEPPAPKKKCQLPWWCTIVGWILLVLVTLMAAALVTFYGISFKDETCKKWITSLIISFFTSVFITQPIKVILTAIFLSLIIKNPGEEEEDEEIDEEKYPMDGENDLLHAQGDATFAAARPRKAGYKPISNKKLEKIRAQRLKEVQMWSVIREIIFYCTFLWILLLISHRNRSPDHFNYKNTMYRTFIKSLDTDISFENIKNTRDFWSWAQSGFVNGIMAGSYYNAYPPLRLRTYINDKASRILGHATLRQLRITPGKCSVPSVFENLIPQCNALYSVMKQEERSFDVGWEPLNDSATPSEDRSEYRWSSGDLLNGYPYWGKLAIYSGGGYVVHLNGTKDEVKEIMYRLERENWIDRYTRAVFAEFTVYNPQVNLFSVNMMLAEFHITNGIVPTYRFEPAMLLPYMNDAMFFQIVCEIAFLLFILGFLIREMIRFYRQRGKYFTLFWNWIELCIISLSITAIVIYFYRLVETKELTNQFKEADGNEYIKFQYVGYWNEIFAYMVGFIVYLATLKFLRLLRFNKRISMLGSTLNHSGKSLLHFSLIFWIIFLAFCQLFFLTYMNTDEKYSTFIESVVASILMMMGKFNIYQMIMVEPILTQIFVLLYVISITFVIVNMFVSILTDTFSSVREDVQKQSNDYEIIEFMLDRLKRWTGIGAMASNTPATTLDPYARGPAADDDEIDDEEEDKKENFDPQNPNMAVFPARIDRLLQSLSTIYRDNQGAGSPRKFSPFGKMPYRAPPRPADPPAPSRPGSKQEKRRTSLAKVDT